MNSPDSPDTLLSQLAQRTKLFKQKTGLTSRQICKLVPGLSEQSLCDFLALRRGLNNESLLQLYTLTKSTKAEVEAKLTKPATSAQIMYLQEAAPMRFDGSGWVPKEGGTDDPDGTGGITDCPTARQPDDFDKIDETTYGFLTGLKDVHRAAIAHIDDYLAKARVNKGPTTEGVRKIDDNIASRTAGPRKDRFALEEAKQRELSAKTDLKIYREIQDCEEKIHAAEVELRRLQQSPAERKEILDRGERIFDSKYQMAH